MMKKLIKDLTLVNWLPNLKIILRGLLNNTEVNAANIKKVSSDIDTTNKKVGKIEGEVEVLREGQEVIKTDVEELKKGGDSVEVDETYLTKDEEGKITFGNNGTVGNIESPIIIVGEREGVTSLLPGSVIVEKFTGEELKLTPDSLGLADGNSSSYYSSRGISYQKGERFTIIDLPESTGETYNLPLTVNGVKADNTGNVTLDVEVVKDFTVDGILPDENGDFKTGYGERIKELEENTSEVKVDSKTITLNNEGEIQLGEIDPVDEGFRILDLKGISIGKANIGQNEGIFVTSDKGEQFIMNYNSLSISRSKPNSPGENLLFFLVNYHNGLELHSSEGKSLHLNPGSISYYNGEKHRNLLFPVYNSENVVYSPVSVNGVFSNKEGNIDLTEVLKDLFNNTSPDGTKWKLGVDNNGNLITTKAE